MNKELESRLRVVYGVDDQLRKWEYVRETYEGRVDLTKVSLVEGMAHNFT